LAGPHVQYADVLNASLPAGLGLDVRRANAATGDGDTSTASAGGSRAGANASVGDGESVHSVIARLRAKNEALKRAPLPQPQARAQAQPPQAQAQARPQPQPTSAAPAAIGAGAPLSFGAEKAGLPYSPFRRHTKPSAAALFAASVAAAGAADADSNASYGLGGAGEWAPEEATTGRSPGAVRARARVATVVDADED
jgi:hypothetical protein